MTTCQSNHIRRRFLIQKIFSTTIAMISLATVLVAKIQKIDLSIPRISLGWAKRVSEENFKGSWSKYESHRHEELLSC